MQRPFHFLSELVCLVLLISRRIHQSEMIEMNMSRSTRPGLLKSRITPCSQDETPCRPAQCWQDYKRSTRCHDPPDYASVYSRSKTYCVNLLDLLQAFDSAVHFRSASDERQIDRDRLLPRQMKLLGGRICD